MKSACNWTVWESKDGLIKRIYVAKDKWLEEGANGLCQQSGGFSAGEIAFAVKVINGKNFSEMFEQVKAANARDRKGKKTAAALKKEKAELLSTAKNDAEREEIIMKYAKLIKAAKYA